MPVNIYAPNDANQQVTFFKELENQLEDFAQENIIIAGDFNCALSENDKKGGNPVWKKSIVIKEVQHLANLYNLTDIWRDRNPNDNRFTWRNKSLKIQCRLDFFLISKELSSDTHACNLINAPETDHSAFTLHLKAEDLLQPKAPGFWKFNISLHSRFSRDVTVLSKYGRPPYLCPSKCNIISEALPYVYSSRVLVAF